MGIQIDQHCVAPLVNIATSKIGIRKILCFFLVDPTYRTISTSIATNTHWLRLLPKLTRALTLLLPTTMPSVIIRIIAEYMSSGMTHREALAVRASLMNERKYFVDEHNQQWQREFSLCEH
jgi:hypothetical protein